MLHLKSTLNFGKYKDSTVEQVIKDDPEYLAWAIDECIITLDQDANDALEFALYDDDAMAYDGFWG